MGRPLKRPVRPPMCCVLYPGRWLSGTKSGGGLRVSTEGVESMTCAVAVSRSHPAATRLCTPSWHVWHSTTRSSSRSWPRRSYVRWWTCKWSWEPQLRQTTPCFSRMSLRFRCPLRRVDVAAVVSAVQRHPHRCLSSQMGATVINGRKSLEGRDLAGVLPGQRATYGVRLRSSPILTAESSSQS
jgi:hypothetical protein